MGEKLILVGGFHEMIELCCDCNYHVVGIIDNEIEGEYYGIPIIGKDCDAPSLYDQYKDCYISITPDSPKVRQFLSNYYKGIGFKIATIISPYAHISKSAFVGEGTVIQSGVNVSSAVRIGRFCKLNTNCNVMHDNTIGNYTTIAPNAVSLGKVEVGDCSYLGANCTILPSIRIGKDVIIGAGSVVTHNIDDGKIVKGIPAH